MAKERAIYSSRLSIGQQVDTSSSDYGRIPSRTGNANVLYGQTNANSIYARRPGSRVLIDEADVSCSVIPASRPLPPPSLSTFKFL